MASNRLAPEWARQDAVILVWPHSNSDWIDQLSAIERTYLELSRYISRYQKLILVTYNKAHHQYINDLLSKHSIQQNNIIFLEIVTDDTWVRDFGPIYVASNNDRKMLNFTFNAWGGKYPHENDDEFNQNFKQKISNGVSSHDIDFILEGGNLEINSQGLLLSSSSCFERELTVRHANERHKNLESIQSKLREWFGCEKNFWIHDVILAGDDTGGHIDTLTRFCKDDVIAYSAQGHHTDPNAKCLQSLERQVKKFHKQDPSISEIIPLPCPLPIFNNSHQLPATYVNFLITNQHVFVPVFNDKQDNKALKILDDLFPSREIIDIESNALIQQYGGIHCASMQIPYGSLSVDE